jgi:hypothetical protein
MAAGAVANSTIAQEESKNTVNNLLIYKFFYSSYFSGCKITADTVVAQSQQIVK